MVCELYLNKADTKKKREEAAEDEKVAMYIRIVIRIKPKQPIVTLSSCFLQLEP